MAAGFIFTAGPISTFLSIFFFPNASQLIPNEPVWHTIAGFTAYLLGLAGISVDDGKS
jgi:hypothetical protein